MTNERIVEELEKLGYPAFKDDVLENELNNNYNYFIFTETKARVDGCRWYQDITIKWVNENVSNENYFEKDIYNSMKAIGLKLNGDITYEIQEIGDTNRYVQIVSFIFTRPI